MSLRRLKEIEFITPEKGKKHRKKIYQETWESEFEWLNKSKKGDFYYFCTICNYNGTAGRSEVQRHSKSKRHIAATFSSKTQSSLFSSITENNLPQIDVKETVPFEEKGSYDNDEHVTEEQYTLPFEEKGSYDENDGHVAEEQFKTQNKLLEKQAQISALEVLTLATNFVTEQLKLKEVSKEKEFCNYLCSQLKKIKSENIFEDLKMEILQLVYNKIKEERETK
ncbi:uncharacterized protein LOC129605898 isoform X1 [Condylostylus longicornis]|uniref:uncharacterized protein LOC129605898 isoform X1 n=1 Tax=Condylostylus longicornis TaxID=2530218 RepID=UPI00244E4719|nr:uncharacterized protein LOC129605898 isoform X1 [Condylostylus longicornis]